jgi:hypothetical protein
MIPTPSSDPPAYGYGYAARAAVESTPVYDELRAEWEAFGLYWPGADRAYAVHAHHVPAASPYVPAASVCPEYVPRP